MIEEYGVVATRVGHPICVSELFCDRRGGSDLGGNGRKREHLLVHRHWNMQTLFRLFMLTPPWEVKLVSRLDGSTTFGRRGPVIAPYADPPWDVKFVSRLHGSTTVGRRGLVIAPSADPPLGGEIRLSPARERNVWSKRIRDTTFC